MTNKKTFIGYNSIAEMQRYIHTLSPKKVFLLRGKGSYIACGAMDIMEEILATEKLQSSEWFDFLENPKIEDVKVGVELLKESQADIIIAIGGGSVIDMAKLVRFSYSYEGELTSNFFTKKQDLLPFIALPTTSGTGCEATPFAVCYKDKVKYSVAHEDMLPDIAAIYPPFTYDNSSYLTACTGFDALAQATEAYWNINATTESDRYSEEAISLLWKNIYEAVNKPTEQVRDAMCKGAYLAGKAIAITKTTAPHAFSYAFTTYCDYPHGHAVALTFPFFFDLNVCRFKGRLKCCIQEEYYELKMQKLRGLFGVEADTALNKVQTLIENIGLHNRGCKDNSLHALLSLVNIQRLDNNPCVIDEGLMYELERYMNIQIHNSHQSIQN